MSANYDKNLNKNLIGQIKTSSPNLRHQELQLRKRIRKKKLNTQLKKKFFFQNLLAEIVTSKFHTTTKN